RTARNRVALHLGSASQVAQTSPPHPSPVTSSSLRPPFSRLFGPETPLRAGTPSAGRRPSGSRPTAGRRPLQAERPKRVEIPFGSRRFDDHSRRHRLDPAVARPRGSTMTTTAQNTTSSDQNSQ